MVWFGLVLAGLLEINYHVFLGVFAKSLDSSFLVEFCGGGYNGDFLCAWLVAGSKFHALESFQFGERRTDALFAAASDDAGHRHRVGDVSTCVRRSAFFTFFAGVAFLGVSGLHEVHHHKACRFVAEALHCLFLVQLVAGGNEGDFLGAGLVASGNFDVGDTFELGKRRTDVFFYSRLK